MKKIDTRVQYTREMFHRALLNLLEIKPLSRITIKELCENAGLNRGTFYLHYTDAQDILTEIEEDFIARNLSFFTTYLSPQHNTDTMESLFTSILKDQDLFRIICKASGSSFTQRLKMLVKPAVLQDWQRDWPDYKISDLEFVFDFVFAGSMQLISDLPENTTISAKKFAQRLDRLGHYAHLAIQEFT